MFIDDIQVFVYANKTFDLTLCIFHNHRRILFSNNVSYLLILFFQSDLGKEDVKVSQLDATRIVLRMNRKLHVFNLDSMAVDMILQGFTPKYQSDYLLTKSNREHPLLV